MTRDEFIESINSWHELLEFCRDADCDTCYDVYNESELDEYVNDSLPGLTSEEDWRDIRDILCNIPTGGGYYIVNEIHDIEEADDSDFESYKNDTLDWGDFQDIWEEDEIEEYDIAETWGNVPPVNSAESCEEDLEEPLSISELLSGSNDEFKMIKNQEENKFLSLDDLF